jgi:lipoate-protein ligase A
MFHAPEKEIVYSICAPPGIISKDITSSYRELLAPLVNGLKDLGLNPGIDENNIMIGSNKISGSAQRRTARAILHHGTLLYDVNPYEMFSLIKGRKADVYVKGTCSNYKPVTCILDHSEISLDELYIKTRESILAGKEWERSSWTDKEIQMSKELASGKYNSDDWNLKL